MIEPTRVLAIGAHPDDCEVRVGGTAALWAREGFAVRFLSVANGDAGHHEMSGAALAERRRREAQEAAAVIGIESLVLPFHDGEVMPDLESRKTLARAIRSFRPDLIVTHRPNDYHPDHRYTSQLVQDCCYMLCVPNFCPDSPALASNPATMYMMDTFRKPLPFQADIAVDIEPVLDEKVAMLNAHASQMFEWLPWIEGGLEKMHSAEARRDFVMGKIMQRCCPLEGSEAVMARTYGPGRAARVRYVESFEACEYGAPIDDAALRRFFPFAFCASGSD